MLKKKLAMLLAVVMMLGCLAGCGGDKKEDPAPSAPEQSTETPKDAEKVDPIVYRVSSQAADGQPIDVGLDTLAQLVEERTEGRVKIEVFPGGTLGTEGEMRDMVEEGTLDMCSIGYTIISNWYKELYLPQMLFGFASVEECLAIMEGEFGQKYFNEPLMNEHGIRALDQWGMAPRILMSKKPVRTLEDLKGLKLRIPSGLPVREESYKRLGAMTVSLGLADTYTAISQGVCDAVELPIDSLAAYHFNEECKYLTFTNHMIYSNALLMNEDNFQKMSAEDQEIFLQCVEEAGTAMSDNLNGSVDGIYEAFKADGVELIELSDAEMKKFQDVITPLYDEYMGEWGETAYNDFMAAMDKIR